MPVKGFDYTDLGGGLNAGASPASIESRQMSALENFYPTGAFLRRRGGTRQITTNSAWDQNIPTMVQVKTSSGDWNLITLGITKVGYLSGDRVKDFTLGTDVSIPSSTLPWSTFVYKNYLYALRRGSRMLRIRSGETVHNAGIDAPISAPVLADGGTGTLVAGTYRTVYTYYNTATATESNPSPEGEIIFAASDGVIDYSALVASSNAFVDTIRVYRSLEDQEGVFFLVDSVANGVTTLAGDTKSAAELGRAVRFDNGTPALDLELGTVWQERAWVTNGTELAYSNIGTVEGFGDESILTVNEDDGHKIRGLCPVASGERLVVGKTNTMWYVSGSGPGTFRVGRLSEKTGCRSHHSMQSVGNTIFWFGAGKSVWRADGGQASEVTADLRVKRYLEAVPDAMEEYVIGSLFPKLGWYCLTLPQTGFTTSRVVLIYNYRENTWTVFTYPSNAPQHLLNVYNTDFGEELYATFYDGHIYKFNDSTYPTDFGTSIAAILIPRADDFGAPGFRKWYEEVWLLCAADPNASLRIQVYPDNSSTAVADRTVTLYDDHSGWRAYKLGMRSSMGTKLQMKITYTGETAIDLEALHFEVGLTGRAPARPR